MFKFIKNLTKETAKVNNDNLALEELRAVQDREKETSKVEQRYLDLLEESTSSFRAIIAKPEDIDKDKLQECAEKLLEVIEIKPSKPNAYVYLSYIYYILNNDELTLKYLKTATFLDTKEENKVFISELKDLIAKKNN